MSLLQPSSAFLFMIFLCLGEQILSVSTEKKSNLLSMHSRTFTALFTVFLLSLIHLPFLTLYIIHAKLYLKTPFPFISWDL